MSTVEPRPGEVIVEVAQRRYLVPGTVADELADLRAQLATAEARVRTLEGARRDVLRGIDSMTADDKG